MNIPDIIETIFKPSGITLTTPEGIEYPELLAEVGFHVNFPNEINEISLYLVSPEPITPTRVYFGSPTYYYKFPDKETFLQYFPETNL